MKEKIVLVFCYVISINVAISNSYYQPNVMPQNVGEETHYKEYNRDHNPLRFRPRMWSCEKGKCVRKLLNFGDKRLNSTEYESDKRY